MVAAVENDRKMGGKPNYNLREKSKQHYMHSQTLRRQGLRERCMSTRENVILAGQ